jgi:hypothetical protein
LEEAPPGRRNRRTPPRISNGYLDGRRSSAIHRARIVCFGFEHGARRVTVKLSPIVTAPAD